MILRGDVVKKINKLKDADFIELREHLKKHNIIENEDVIPALGDKDLRSVVDVKKLRRCHRQKVAVTGEVHQAVVEVSEQMIFQFRIIHQ